MMAEAYAVQLREATLTLQKSVERNLAAALALGIRPLNSICFVQRLQMRAMRLGTEQSLGKLCGFRAPSFKSGFSCRAHALGRDSSVASGRLECSDAQIWCRHVCGSCQESGIQTSNSRALSTRIKDTHHELLMVV